MAVAAAFAALQRMAVRVSQRSGTWRVRVRATVVRPGCVQCDWFALAFVLVFRLVVPFSMYIIIAPRTDDVVVSLPVTPIVGGPIICVAITLALAVFFVLDYRSCCSPYLSHGAFLFAMYNSLLWPLDGIGNHVQTHKSGTTEPTNYTNRQTKTRERPTKTPSP